ncbi:hypothetical protein [Heliophilum fasciatum]|uniref:Uncharacterized protein n=1 Tax=Heliophilum fasciatum TaxID=35700 RepID=A0A4R2REK5_9FIRM|nr:hypothetical protein [Heliophilum fasciatum]MCW2279109.1 hypothetical protein [Heliophilum fasciatum]TCP61263.1 hypothetical protein EDD73_12916 [Heliophilum fasciatum]
MANKHKALVEIVLDKPRTLRYDLNALAEMEAKLGVSLQELDQLTMGVKQLRTFLWAGLIHEDPTLTEHEVGGWVDMDTLSMVNEKITEAFQLATGKN